MIDPLGSRSRQRASATLAMALALGASAALVTPSPVVGATTFVVNRIGDQADLNLANAACDVSPNTGKQCTLRAAIQEANDTPGADTINFNITSASKVIAPASPLPPITGPVTINGYSQSGASANTQATGNNAVLRIVLDGVNAGVDAMGLSLQASNSSIRGLVVQRWSGVGIALAGSGNTVSGTFIGTNASGTAARGNGIGVLVQGASHTIGGANPGGRNVISGNADQGMLLTDVDGTLIAGNYIGTNAAGTAQLGNLDSGVIFDGGNNNVVGNGTGGAPNVISGNEQNGIKFTGTASSQVLGNLIGTDASGNSAVGNGQDGIALQMAVGITIGGTSASQRNIVSANQVGIRLGDSDGNTVVGNRLGTRADGLGNLGNRFGGIIISGSDNQIGGGAAGAGNLIAHSANGSGITIFATNLPVDNLIQGNTISGHAGFGIAVEGARTRILSNSIVANGNDGIQVGAFNNNPLGVRISGNITINNGGLGIDLHSLPDPPFSVTPNDLGDGDGGPNGLQNFPVIASAIRQANGLTTVSMRLNSSASTEFRIELFLAAPDPSGHGEAQTPFVAQTITTNASGNRSFTFQLGGLVAGQQLTATAISEATDNTSEFSKNLPIVQAPPP